MMRKKKGRGGGEVSYAGAKGRSKRLSPLADVSLPSYLPSSPHLEQRPGRGGRPHQVGQGGDGLVRDGGHDGFFFLW